MEPVGYIGVGAMGSAIAGRLVSSYRLFVNDRNPAAADGLVGKGATFATLDEIADACRVVFMCLPGPAEVTDLVTGSGALAELLVAGTVVVDNTTSTPIVDKEIVAALAAGGVEYVDSPIAGGVRRVQAGTAVLMVGADPGVYERVKDILLTITPEVTRVGPVGTGHAMKLVNNLLNGCNRFAALECVRLGEAAGLERNVVIDVINRSSGRNYTTERTYPDLLSGDTYLPQEFTLDLMLKDIRLANELATSLGHTTPVGNLAQQFTQEAIDRFGARADQSQMMAEWYG
jgi:3-hydroxyisobutyrate dehydrogenase